MPRAHNGDVEIEHESFGDHRPETILLVNGLGSQMSRWPDAFCEKLVAKGYRAIRFDNRDTGLSTWPTQPYTLADMARDGIAVLDAAGVQQAHIAGVSMGGMIVQRMALDHPGRILSMTSIMSTTGAPDAFKSTPEAAAVLNLPPPDPKADFEAFVQNRMANARTIGSPAYPWTDEENRARVVAEYQRAFNPAGVVRQRNAVGADGDRTAALKGLKLPVVVLHGADDPLLMKVGGEATAAAIPGAELRIVPGMGHDLPPGLYDIFVDAITTAASRAPILA
ncbi:MAG TPA: alpha/beta hydrolase [Phenylobacterium sp.]|jgi:pimeloyl-ACP methyl ester carboxylesterase|uniref:alpha/beta fold hydrolase n=1 Tax=Phenylobacterium sp. TaxID=1871053 RepID=UPI002D27A5F5|nr:alpha/beta hydrolase [Phenylobacterium sp.]HZZ67887.1 alpha/beta hydrolase [Phenylobacterium sp.]